MASNNVKKSITVFLNGKQVEATVGNLRKKSRELNNEINLLTPGTKKYIAATKELTVVNKRLDNHRKRIKGVGGAFGGLKQVFQSSLGTVAIWTAAIGAAVSVVRNIVKVSSDYASANSKLQAVLTDTTKTTEELTAEMELLEEQSKALGATTAFTASEVAGLQTEFAKLGFPTEDILLMTESTLDGAAAMGSELAPTAALVGATLKAFSLDASQTARVNDVLAASTSSSALDFEKLNASMSTIAPVASKLGFSLEDTVTLLGGLSDAGFDASSAATATRNIFLGLADSNGKLAKSLGGPVKDLPSLIKGLRKLNDEGTDLGEALELTDKRSVAAFSTFLGGTNSLEELSVKLNEAEGSARIMADTMLDNLAGDTAIAQSAWEGFILSLDDGEGIISQALRGLTQGFTELVSSLTNLNNFDIDSIFKSESIEQQSKSMIQLSSDVLTLTGGFNAAGIIQDNLEKNTELLTRAYQKFNKEQLQTKEASKLIVSQFRSLGFTTEEAIKKYKELSGIQTSATKATTENAEEIALATVKQIESIASLNTELQERKKAQEELAIGSQKFIQVGNEIAAIEAKIAAATGKTAKERTKNIDKSLKDLNKLKEGVLKFQTELENRQAVEILKTDDEKELLELEQKLDKKFSKEIATAKKIAEGTGDIAKEGQAQLNALELIKAKELNDGKLKLQQGFLVKSKKEEQQKNTITLNAIKSLADAEVILQQQKLEEISEKDFEARNEQSALVLQALKDRIDAEREIELNALEIKRDEDAISQETFDAESSIIRAEFRQQESDLELSSAAAVEEGKKKIKQAAIDFARFGINAFAQFQQIAAQKELNEIEKKSNAEIDILQKKLDAGTISQENFDKEKLKIEKKADRESAKVKTKAAKAEQTAALIQAAIDTALAIGKAAAAAPPPLNVPLIAFAAATGAIQIALIAAQPTPQFKDGGFHNVVGADDGKTYSAKYAGRPSGLLPPGPQLILANEKGPEYFVPNHLMQNQQVANYVGAIEAIRSGRQMQQGGFTDEVTVGTDPADEITTDEVAIVQQEETAAINTELLIAVNRLNAHLDSGLAVIIGDADVDNITEKQAELEEIKGNI